LLPGVQGAEIGTKVHEAPYASFCDARGRYGTHNPPHLKAPGRVNPNFTVYAAFNAGIQAVDITDPMDLKLNGYYITPTSGDLNRFGSYHRPGNDVFVEWDRNLIWAGTDNGLHLLSHPDLGRPSWKPFEPECLGMSRPYRAQDIL